MVHLLVLGLLALLFDRFIRRIGPGDLFLLYRFPRSCYSEPTVSTITINDFGIVFASHSFALSFRSFEAEAGGHPTKTAARTPTC